MKPPRPSIASLMALVLVAALDAWAVKALAGDPNPLSMQLRDLLMIGGLPMANVLAVALAMLAADRRGDGAGRGGLAGFAWFGLAGHAAFLAGSILFPQTVHEMPIRVLGSRPGPRLVAFAFAAFFAPQLAVAIVGRRLGRAYAVRWSFAVVRRHAPPPAQAGTAPEGRPIAPAPAG